MRLKSLRLHGFKSFALRTEFTFPRGLTCIVGPNGCGKSNVVDAIKWVMGEQRPTALRGTEMADVIFGGTAARKQLGMAEVTLVFDNSERTLDVDWTEVEVTRRLYRDGNSEYLLNKNRCRLKDLRELFMDTGSGRGAMTIMEQGKIDQILKEGHQERRLVFEEAAGIAKYKARRKESLRRLEKVEADLLRVSDVVTEKQRLVRSLKIQAGRAERYQVLVDEMRTKRLQLAVHRYGRLLGEREDASARVAELAAAEAAARAEVQKALADCRVAEDELERSRVETSRLEQEIASLEGRADTAREKSTFAARLVAELDGKIRWYTDEIENGAVRLQDLEGVRAEVAEALVQAQRDRDARQGEVRASEDVIRSRADDVAGCRREAEAAARALSELMERRSRLESRRSRIEARHQALGAQRARLTERLASLEAETATARERATAADAARAGAGARVEAARATLDDAQAARTAAETAARTARDAVTAQDREVSALRSRADVLTHLCRQMEGVAEGARKLVAAARSGVPELAGVRGLLVERIETAADRAAAVESALGAHASAVIVDTFDDVERVAEYVARKRLGRCLLLPQDAVVPQGALRGDSLSADVRCEPGVRALVDAVLGNAVRVETLAAARAARAAGPDDDAARWLRLVTAGGEVLEPTGAVAVGGEAGGAGVLKRLSELRELTARLATLTADLVAARGAAQVADAAFQESRQTVGAAREALRSAESDAQRTENDAQRAAADLVRMERDGGRLAADAAEIDGELTRLTDEAAVVATETTALGAERDATQERRDAATRVHAEAETRLRAAESERADLRVRLASVVERCVSLEARARSVDSEARDLEEGVLEAQTELVGCERRRKDAEERGHQARHDLAEAQKRRDVCVIGLAEFRHRLSASKSRLDERRGLLGALEKESSAVGKELQKFRLRQNEARVRVEGLIERIQEELEIDLHAAWESADRRADGADADRGAPQADDAGFDPQAVEAEIQDLRDRIGRMGNVNLEALDQLETVEREATDLQAQHDDLTRSREKLLEAIRRIDAESRELFTTTFEAIRKNFRVMFRRLFEGGKADVYMDESQDVLEAGIDIVARPPGKEPRSISLLSGGERTMTAVALLFAIYQAKPSPFCLLDEVDAALDESNVDRFASVVHEFSEKSQFIIISHNKRTMSAADTIFGVSMPEPGVSRRLAVRLDQVGEDGSILAA